MFLHIGNNVLIRKDEIIGIFNISSLAEDIKGKKFLNEVRHAKEMKDISGGKQTSIVLTDGGPYISRISTMTLQARSRDTVQEMLSAETPPGAEHGEDEAIELEELSEDLPIADAEEV
jgi:hypothetical protein